MFFMSVSVPMVITIDGPSGSGKGTLSQMLARHLKYHLLDSGALYRLVALAAINKGVRLSDEQGVSKVAVGLDVKFSLEKDEAAQILLDGVQVASAIRQEVVSMAASQVAAYPDVRVALLERQRAFAVEPGLVADGRDMGTTVFPRAQVKLFLTASAEARAERRYKQLYEKGESVVMSELINDIRERDERDSNRSISPLKPAWDAVIIDSTAMSIDEFFTKMLAAITAASACSNGVNKR